MGINVNVTGTNQLIANLETFSQRKVQAVKQAVQDNTFRAEAQAKRGAPVDTGFMRNNIRSTFNNSGFMGTVTAQANYSFFVEFGTRKMRAQPFMFPAFLSVKARFIQDLERIMGS